MNSIHLDYPIHRRMQNISAEDIPTILPRVDPKEPGYRIQGTKAILIPEDWWTYLFCTNHEDRSYDLLHHVIASGEDPEPAFQFVLEYLGTLGFRRIRSIADSIRFLLDTAKVITDRATWNPFLEKLDAEADKLEHLYHKISHIDWVVPGPEYTLMVWCRDQKLRYLDVSVLVEEEPYHRIKDPDIFRKAIACYGAATWFPADGGMEIDISPEWCYENGVEVDLLDLAKAIHKETPIDALDLAYLETPRLSIGRCTVLSDLENTNQYFLELCLPNPADEEYPMTSKRYYGNVDDMEVYIGSAGISPWATILQNQLTIYRHYSEGDTQAKEQWLNLSAPLISHLEAEFTQQICLENVSWCHVDRQNRLIPLRARKILLDQVILDVEGAFIPCVRPTFEGLEQADYQLSRWMPVDKERFSANVIENWDGKFVSLLYMDSGRYSSLGLALTAMEHPEQLNLRAVMDEFFGDFAI